MSNAAAIVTIRVSEGASPGESLVSFRAYGPPGLELDATVPLDPLTDLCGLPLPASSDALIELGDGICQALLPGRLCTALVGEVESQASAGKRTRLYFELEPASLQSLPVEAIYLGSAGTSQSTTAGFLGLHPMVDVIRSVGEQSGKAPAFEPPVRVLLAHADPGSPAFPSLPAARLELTSVRRAMELPELRSSNVKLLENASQVQLRRALSDFHPNVFHFIGHGGITASGEFIVMEGAQPATDSPLYADDLAGWLNAAGVSLCILSACHSSAASLRIARALNRHGMAATIGMQFAWSDAAAGVFSRVFYSALAESMPLERALWQARQAIRGFGADWAAPVLCAVRPKIKTEQPAEDAFDARHATLPYYPTDIIGRSEDAEVILQRLASNRLITLTGAGGVGKTRLAVHVAGLAAPGYTDSWSFVSFATVSRPDLVPQAVAAMLGVREDAGSSLTDLLVHYLRQRSCLLVLDNCEHVRPAVAQLTKTLLTSCPGLKIVATSRESLGIPGEINWLVSPLQVPTSADFSGGNGSTGTLLAEFPAARLFIDRASAVNRRFSVDESNAEAVATICGLLDGLPLAIELAAAHVQSLPVREIAERLAHRFEFLVSSEERLPHQQTIQSTMDWSYDLLTESEMALFAALSIFVGGWTLEAAEDICGNAGLGVTPGEVLRLIAQLVRKSLLIYEDHADGGRYRMLETVRAYAREKLSEDKRKRAVARNHARWFAELAEHAELGIRGPEQMTWLARVDVEHDNLRAAIAWSIKNRKDAESGLRVAAALWQYWAMRGQFGQGRHWLETALSAYSNNDVLAAKGISGVSLLAAFQADSPTASDAGKRALQISTDAKTPWLIAQSMLVLGYSYWTSQPDEAKSILEKSVSVADESDNLWLRTVTRLTLTAHDLMYGRHERARSFLSEAVPQARVLSDNWLIAESMWYLGELAAVDGQHAKASEFLVESAALYRPLGDFRTLAHVLSCLGASYICTGQLDAARGALREGLRLARELDDRRCLAAIYSGMSAIMHRQSRLEIAIRLLAVASQLPQESTLLGQCWHLTDHASDLLESAGQDRYEFEWQAGLVLSPAQIEATARAVLDD